MNRHGSLLETANGHASVTQIGVRLANTIGIKGPHEDPAIASTVVVVETSLFRAPGECVSVLLLMRAWLCSERTLPSASSGT